MRNYIILNDINSNSIKGLLIQNLPPISKPLMRTQIEEIDGRPGDIVTNLGFSAYDKTFSIGLYGNFDIDEVMEYFNSNGIVVFSNEPDKYYNYTITSQVDFQKLLRFKTAEITMHVQPYKYSQNDGVKTIVITDSQEITIENRGNTTAKPTFTIYGSGSINFYLNDIQMFQIELGEIETEITIDIENMEAYNKETSILKNRLVTGNYDNFELQRGENKITWTGTINKIEIEKFSRWI